MAANPLDPPPAAASLVDLEGIWPQLAASVRAKSVRKAALLRDAVPTRVVCGTVFLTVPSVFFLETLQADEGLQVYLAEHATALLGSEVRFAFELIDEG